VHDGGAVSLQQVAIEIEQLAVERRAWWWESTKRKPPTNQTLGVVCISTPMDTVRQPAFAEARATWFKVVLLSQLNVVWLDNLIHLHRSNSQQYSKPLRSNPSWADATSQASWKEVDTIHGSSGERASVFDQLEAVINEQTLIAPMRASHTATRPFLIMWGSIDRNSPKPSADRKHTLLRTERHWKRKTEGEKESLTAQHGNTKVGLARELNAAQTLSI
jgi:hypothetical protein